MSCGIGSGIGIDCEALKRVGGVNKKAWIFNIDDLNTYTTGSDGCINQINFNAYAGLYEFDSRKQAHSGGYVPVIGGEGGNKFFQHDVQLKLFSDTCVDDQVIEDLLVAQVGIILETNNQEFKLFGGFNGMDQTGGSQSSGQAAASDIADTLIFQGEERDLPKRILDTDYETTKAYIESLVV
jgi:hypothetical protein